MGAGCSAATTDDATTDVSNADNDPQWWLSFDLPEGWVRVAHYGSGKVEMPSDEAITATSTDIVLQSASEPISIDGQVSENWTVYVESDYAYIRVFRYTALRPVPDDATDLGNGFYETTFYDDLAYWFPQEFGNYLFTVKTDGEQDMSVIEDIIFSAQEHDLSDQL